VRIGDKFRQFTAKTCSAFDTKELDREFGARMWRQEKEAQDAPQRKNQQQMGPEEKNSIFYAINTTHSAIMPK